MIGEKIRELRQNIGLLQSELAQKIGVSTSTIGMYEQNRRDPDTDTLKRLADFFNVSTDYLLGRTLVEQIDKKLQNNDIAIAANSKVDLGKLAQIDNKTAKLINTLIDDFLSEDEE